MSIFLILSVIALLIVFTSSVIIAVGLRKMHKLGEIGLVESVRSPLVSLIIPACNEEENIGKSLLSFVSQDYQNLEIIVVNDRSIDNTANILKKLKGRFPQLIVLEITELPKGWMGKSHALARGAAVAQGKYLLFTDADVILEKTTVARAVGYMTEKSLDHLTLTFKNLTQGWLLNSLILDTGLGLLFAFKPWMAKKRGTSHFVGIGAFNMVKKTVYQEIGGHESIKMHPIDDMMLGKVIKEHGFYQDCLLAYDFVRIPWYASVSEMVNGLQKNMFALVHYRILLIPVLLLAIIIVTILPVWGIFLADNYVRVICVLTVGIRLVTFYRGLRLQGLPCYYLPGCLITPYISCYIILKSAVVTIRQGGISWRGKHYALSDLRKTTPFLF